MKKRRGDSLVVLWAAAVVTFILTLAVIAFLKAAKSHEWMPADTKWCCNDRDCLPYPREKVKRTAEGWYVPEFDHLFRDGERGVYPNFAPDLADIWLCRPAWQPKPVCIFVEPEGS